MNRRSFLQGASGLGFTVAVDGRAFAADVQKAAQAGAGSARADRSSPGAAKRFVDEPNMHRETREVDLLVAGGGMSGVCAALAAARNGAKVLLVQDRSRLGGNASSEIRMHIVGADQHGSRSGWREGGLIEEIRLEDAVRNPHRAWELFDLTLYDLCQREPNLELLLDSSVFGAEVDNDRITTAWVRCDKTETMYAVQAHSYVDATGDGRLALEAGAAFREGREPRSTYNESLALEEGDDKSQGCTILFTAREHDRPMPFVAPPWAREITENDLLFRGIGSGSFEYGYWWIELGGTLDVIRENEQLRYELLRIVLGVWDWIKNSGKRKNSENWALETVGMIPGKRESRRLTGAHIQTQADLQGDWKKRDDGVSIGGWGFDEHPPGGFDAWDQPPYYSKPVPEPYNIAFEALYSGNVSNLMMAGRNISNSHVAFTSTRVMATCACTGQAVGTAAALCARLGVAPAELRSKHMQLLQQTLLRDDQSIRQVEAADSYDLAPQATLSASAALPDAGPEHLTDGHVRDEPGKWEHRWGAPAEDDTGRANAWVDLTWQEPVELSMVQLTHDSGFHRELTLSAQNGRSASMVRAPQPETVRDYRLIGELADGSEVVLADVTGNYQRLRRHRFDSVRARRMRIQVTATNGSPQVRLYEVRCYA